ncbi:hypothetical protein N9850_09075 [Granulosicoccus sp.]|nr:hypothetical protein [Granulosicoccus sp.]MDB4223912.1 hypothetical protein [Granulosicoccus sp.]
MTPDQTLWLEAIAKKIPILLKAVSDGQYKAEIVIGRRLIGGKACRLYLIAEVIEPED